MISQGGEACRYAAKRTFSSHDHARTGAEDIRAKVEASGDTYTTLYPYLCPDAEHWHLSHYPQGTATCPQCSQPALAWDGGQSWVLSAHLDSGAPCSGEGTAVGSGVAS